jgi:hypothetical protein
MSNPQCSGHRADGEQCKRRARNGGTVCDSHGGRAPQVARKAAVRAEVLAWGLDQPTVDPGTTLLQLVSMAAGRLRLVSGLLERQFTDADGEPGEPDGLGEVSIPAGVRALIGHKYDLTRDGDPVATSEAVRGLAVYEAEWTDRLGRLCKLALDAGIAERQVRLAEQQGALVADAIDRILAALGLSEEQRALVPVVVPRELRAVTAG